MHPSADSKSTTVTVFHFADYHSQAVPFYSEGRPDQGGIARVIGYLRRFASDPNVLIFNGGDMMNLDAPAWAVKYTCAEWEWFNGIVDAMAFGNHDADYGPEHFAACRNRIDYPILGANVLDADGRPVFLHDGKNYLVLDAGGVRIGVFAVAGPDFDLLVPHGRRPVAGARFSDPVESAAEVVRSLRKDEGVQAVIAIGHQHLEDDIGMAQQVPGIDLILGSHSHVKREFERLPGTSTHLLSPDQYLVYIARVDLTFVDGVLTDAKGALLPVDGGMPADPVIERRVADMQALLEADPDFAPLFEFIGEAETELSEAGKLTGETVLGNLAMDILREAAGAHLALTTSSTLRRSIPPGGISTETLGNALPYANQILVFPVRGADLQDLLDQSLSRRGTDLFSQVSGVRFAISENRAARIEILNDPWDPGAAFVPLQRTRTYLVATTDFQGLTAPGYAEIFARGGSPRRTGLDLRTLVGQYIRSHSPVRASVDGRIFEER